VATHWSGELHAEMIAAFAKSDLETAREINARLLDSFAFEVGPTWVQASAVKAALAVLGLPGGPCRLPLPPVSDEAIAEARRVVGALGVSR
jgi:4-hydroxy-tetrahydrodipicolinate synthase